MYANLEVDYFDPKTGARRRISACWIERRRKGTLTITEDLNDGDGGDYAEPGRRIRIPAENLIGVGAAF